MFIIRLFIFRSVDNQTLNVPSFFVCKFPQFSWNKLAILIHMNLDDNSAVDFRICPFDRRASVIDKHEFIPNHLWQTDDIVQFYQVRKQLGPSFFTLCQQTLIFYFSWSWKRSVYFGLHQLWNWKLPVNLCRVVILDFIFLGQLYFFVVFLLDIRSPLQPPFVVQNKHLISFLTNYP